MNHAIKLALKGLPDSLYRPEEEHDSCGVGFVAAINGERSNRVLRHGLTSKCNMAHRGAMDADAKTGDGSGVMTQIPYKLFRKELTKLGHTLYNDTDLGVGFVFLPLQVLAFATLPPQYRTDGASLFSLFRNIGAAVGVSVTSTMLARNTQVLHEQITPAECLRQLLAREQKPEVGTHERECTACIRR